MEGMWIWTPNWRVGASCLYVMTLWFVTWRIGCIVPVHMPAGPPFSNSLAMLPRAPFGNLTWQWERQILDRDSTVSTNGCAREGCPLQGQMMRVYVLALIEPANPSNVPLGGFIWVPPLKHPLKWFSLIQKIHGLFMMIHDDSPISTIKCWAFQSGLPWAVPTGSPNPAFASPRASPSSVLRNTESGHRLRRDLERFVQDPHERLWQKALGELWGNCFSWIVQLVEL